MDVFNMFSTILMGKLYQPPERVLQDTQKLPKIYSPSWYHMLNIMVNFQDTMPKVPTNIWGTWGLKILALFASLNSYRGPNINQDWWWYNQNQNLMNSLIINPCITPYQRGKNIKALPLAWHGVPVTCPWSEVIVGALESEENGAAYVFERTAPIDHQWLSQRLGLKFVGKE